MIERIHKIISSYGLISRRKAEELIEQGRISVNGKIAKIGDKADSEKDLIKIDGKPINKERKRYIVFNKPKFVLCTMEHVPGRKSLSNYIRIKERIYPAGRLDYDSEGLVFLTNDGEITNRITHPRYEIEKEYFVKINKPIREPDVHLLRKGIMLEDGMSWPARVKVLNDERTILSIIIHEGRKWEVKRMFQKLGYEMNSLLRTRIGNIFLGDLRQGRFRKLSYQELQNLKKLLGIV